MNKLVKGSIAGAAGIALLLGGAGTLALWNDTADIDNVQVSAGNLTLTNTGTGSWDSNPAKWVPGDTFTYTDTVTVVATGDNIKATLSVDETSISGDAELLSVLDISMAADISGYATGIAVSGGSYEISAAGTYVLPVTVTVTFDSVSDNTTQNQNVNLDNLGFKLAQHL